MGKLAISMAMLNGKLFRIVTRRYRLKTLHFDRIPTHFPSPQVSKVRPCQDEAPRRRPGLTSMGSCNILCEDVPPVPAMGLGRGQLTEKIGNDPFFIIL